MFSVCPVFRSVITVCLLSGMEELSQFKRSGWTEREKPWELSKVQEILRWSYHPMRNTWRRAVLEMFGFWRYRPENGRDSRLIRQMTSRALILLMESRWHSRQTGRADTTFMSNQLPLLRKSNWFWNHPILNTLMIGLAMESICCTRMWTRKQNMICGSCRWQESENHSRS